MYDSVNMNTLFSENVIISVQSSVIGIMYDFFNWVLWKFDFVVIIAIVNQCNMCLGEPCKGFECTTLWNSYKRIGCYC